MHMPAVVPLLASPPYHQKDDVVSGRLSETLNPWCCRLSRGEAKFQQQRLAAVPAVSMHIRAAFLLRLNDRIEVYPSGNFSPFALALQCKAAKELRFYLKL